VLRCFAVCCSVLQRVAVVLLIQVTTLSLGEDIVVVLLQWCFSVLQCVVVCDSMLLCVAVCCSGAAVVIQCDAACCSVLQRVAAYCSVLQRVAMCCNVLQWCC